MMSQKAYKSGSTYPELQKGKLRIYSSRLCPYAERARLVLAHKNIPHEVVNIELKDKPEWFLALCPLGKVPAIELDDKILVESTAVSEYLDDAYPGDKLQPSNPYRKAMDRVLLEQFGQLSAPFYFIMMNAGREDKQEEVEAKGEQLVKALKYYESELTKREGVFFGGERPAMIDFYIWPYFERFVVVTMAYPKATLSKSEFPKLANWWENMTQVPAVKTEMHDADWHIQILSLYKQGKPAEDYGLED